MERYRKFGISKRMQIISTTKTSKLKSRTRKEWGYNITDPDGYLRWVWGSLEDVKHRIDLWWGEGGIVQKDERHDEGYCLKCKMVVKERYIYRTHSVCGGTVMSHNLRNTILALKHKTLTPNNQKEVG